MEKSAADFDDPPERARDDHVADPLRGGIERKFGRAAHEHVRPLAARVDDRAVGGEIDAEGLFAEEMLVRFDGGDIRFLMQIVRHRDVERVDAVVLEQLAPVGRRLPDR
jgi:hypothetical protein